MACELVAMGSIGTCVPNNGGIVKSFATNLASITTATITAGVVSNFTMSGIGLWKEYTYDLDGTANFNQVGALANNRSTIEQTSFMKFKGISQAYVDAANKSKDCCNVVFIHVLANGTRLIQGFEYLTLTGTPQRTANRETRIVPSINTEVAANEAKVEYSATGNANTFGNTTTLSDVAILAL